MTSSSPKATVPKLNGSLCERWTATESKLHGLLASSRHASDFPQKVVQLAAWIDQLVEEDSAGTQFLLFHRAVTQYIGYSALHALLCAVLCRLVSRTFSVPDAERRSLVCAALTMNMGITLLKDELALQKHAPTDSQQLLIQNHPAASHQMLVDAGVTDQAWLQIVTHHHAPLDGGGQPTQLGVVGSLVKILQTVDRFTAAMSPRKSRAGKSAHDSVRSMVLQKASRHDDVGVAMLQLLGVCPPGTYVRLSNGETAVVLRRGSKPALPTVASVINRNNEPIAIPRSRDLAAENLSLQETLPASQVRVTLALELMLSIMPKSALV